MKAADVPGRTYAAILAAVAVFSAGIALLFYATGVMHDTELSSVDSRFKIRGNDAPRDDIVLVQLTTDENPRTARAYRVMSLPTLLVFRGGEVVASIVGARPKAHLREALVAHL